MKDIKKRIECLKGVLSNTMESARIAIRDIVKANGGFVFVDDSGDTIYGYSLDEDETLQEYYVRGLRVNKSDEVEVFLAPILRGVNEIYTEDYLKNHTEEDEWQPLNGADACLYPWETTISILESIEQYAK